jgi:molybdopterin molybdotransferase
MIGFDEALARVLDVRPLERHETVPFHDAHGRVLTETLYAASPLPPHDYSAMDGYALHSSSVEEAAPAELRVVGESRAGAPPPPLAPGTACRIFTGAPLPAGADAVVMQEDVVRTDDVIRIGTRPRSGDNVRRAGEDLERGAIALPPGTRLGPYQLGLVAALDRANVVVASRPRVTILATGDELRLPGSAGRVASVPESNGVVLAALSTLAGARVQVVAPSSDDLDETRGRVHAALASSDLVVTIGGVSVGDHDVVRPALEAAGVALDFYKVAIKPGKPLTLGRRGSTIVLGVPGNPVSAQVTFALFGVPLLRRLQGDARPAAEPRSVRLSAPIRQKRGRRGFYPAWVAGDVATPVVGFSSGSTVSLARANGLVVVPESCDGLDASARADALMLGEL